MRWAMLVYTGWQNNCFESFLLYAGIKKNNFECLSAHTESWKNSFETLLVYNERWEKLLETLSAHNEKQKKLFETLFVFTGNKKSCSNVCQYAKRSQQSVPKRSLCVRGGFICRKLQAPSVSVVEFCAALGIPNTKANGKGKRFFLRLGVLFRKI